MRARGPGSVATFPRWPGPFLTGAALIAFCAASPLPADDAIVARTLTTVGEVLLIRAGKQPQKPKVGMAIRATDDLKIAEGGKLKLHIKQSRDIQEISAAGTWRVTMDGVPPGPGVTTSRPPERERILLTNALDQVKDEGIAGAVVLRSVERPDLPAIAPIYGTAVMTNEPTLSWSAVPQAKDYSVTVSSRRKRGAEVTDTTFWSHTTKEAQLTCDGARELQPGQTYGWVVRANLENGSTSVLPEGEFKVARERQRKQAEEFASLAKSEDAAILTVAAYGLVQLEAYEDALRAFERLTKMIPDNCDFQAELSKVLSRAGRSKESKQAMARATELGYREESEAAADK